MPYETHIVTANGLQFTCLEMGQGPLVLCFHGFPDTPYGFLPLMEIIAGKGYRVVAPFMRGYAPTQKPVDGDYSITRLAADVLALMDALAQDNEKPLVIGHDWGAFAAYTAANYAPEKFAGLVHMCVPHMHVRNMSWQQVRKSWYVWLFQLPCLPEKKLAQQDFSLVDRLYRDWSPHWQHDGHATDEIKKVLSEPGGVKAALAYYRGMIRGMSRKQWKLMSQQTSVPALVVAGLADGSIDAHQFNGIEKAFVGPFRYVQYDQIGHFPQRECPQQLAEDILEFIEQCAG